MKKNYMETIDNSYKCLITFAHTGKRGTNLSDTPVRNNTLKSLYKDFFTKLIEWDYPLHKNTIKNFCGEWTKFNIDFQNYFSSVFRNLVDTDEQCFNCWLKFKGNCGEIFAEWFFRYGDSHLIEPETYSTIDPNNEDYSDAKAISSEDVYPIQIQIKNWVNKIDSEVFEKAGFQMVITAENLKNQDKNFSYDDYYKTGNVRQIVFSTTNRIWSKAFDIDKILEKGHILFLGPDEIDEYIKRFTKEKFKKQITEKIINKL